MNMRNRERDGEQYSTYMLMDRHQEDNQTRLLTDSVPKRDGFFGQAGEGRGIERSFLIGPNKKKC